MKRLLSLWLAVLVPLVAASCQKKESAVAVVEGDRISQKMFNLHLDERARMLEEQGTAVDRESLRSAVLEQMISERLLVHGAREKGLAVKDEDVRKGVDMVKQRVGMEEFREGLEKGGLTEEEYTGIIREKMLVDAFVDSMVPEDAVAEGDVRAFYDENTSFFQRPETVQVRVIQLKTEEEATEVLDEMDKEGLTFDQMADRLGGEGRAGVGRYTWADVDMFGDEITPALKEMEAGEHGGPYEGKGAYYLIRLKDRKEAGLAGFDEARDEIKRMLLSRKKQEAVVKWLDERKKGAEIEVNMGAGK